MKKEKLELPSAETMYGYLMARSAQIKTGESAEPLLLRHNHPVKEAGANCPRCRTGCHAAATPASKPDYGAQVKTTLAWLKVCSPGQRWDFITELQKHFCFYCGDDLGRKDEDRRQRFRCVFCCGPDEISEPPNFICKCGQHMFTAGPLVDRLGKKHTRDYCE